MVGWLGLTIAGATALIAGVETVFGSIIVYQGMVPKLTWFLAVYLPVGVAELVVGGTLLATAERRYWSERSSLPSAKLPLRV